MIRGAAVALASLVLAPLADAPAVPRSAQIVFSRGGLFTMRSDGTEQRRAALPAYPVFSTRGRYYAYVVGGRDGFARAYVADRAGRRVGRRPLVRTRYCMGDLDWSPDETRLAYANFCEVDFSEIFVVRRDGSGRRRLMRGEWKVKPRWSPDGRTILFAHNPSPHRGWFLYVARPDGTGVRRIRGASLNPDPNADWRWSRDGRRVFLLTAGSLFVVDVRRGGARELVPSLQVQRVSLSPDGRRLAIQAAPRATTGVRDWEIFTLRTDGTELRQLTDNVKQDRDPTWSGDGR